MFDCIQLMMSVVRFIDILVNMIHFYCTVYHQYTTRY